MTMKFFLDSIQSPAPCSKEWNEMSGGEQIRFCQNCEKNVYNLSAMSRGEARKLVAKNAGKICVRYVRLPNGKVQTANSNLHKITGRASRLAAGVLGASLTISALANAQETTTPQKSDKQSTNKKQTKDYSKTSQISFTLYDITKAVIANAQVELTNQETQEKFTVSASQEGIARFDSIPRGQYRVNSFAIGFRRDELLIEIKEPIEPNINITLEAGMIGEFITVESDIPLFRAIVQNDNKAVKQLINSGFKINTKDESGQTALHVTVEHGNLEIVRFLLDKRAKVNVKDKEKRTPLAMLFDTDADEKENVREIIRLLVSKGANINVRDEDSQTFLMRACEDDNLEDVKFFLELGANPNVKDEDGETAMQKTGSEEIKQILRQYGAKE